MKLRHVFLWLTGFFWIGIGYYAVRCSHAVAPASGANAGVLATVLAGQRLPLLSDAEVAQHRTAGDCWLVVNGVVYEASAYLPDHPDKRRAIDNYCGKDGTTSWDAKESGVDKGEAHSVKAHQALAGLPRVGIVKR